MSDSLHSLSEDEELAAIEAKVRAALSRRAEEVEPDPNAYALLAARVVEAQKPPGRWVWGPRMRIAVASVASVGLLAAGVAAVVGGGVGEIDATNGVSVVVAPSSTGNDRGADADADTGPEADAAPPGAPRELDTEGSDQTEENGESTSSADAESGAVVTREEAAEAFLKLVGVGVQSVDVGLGGLPDDGEVVDGGPVDGAVVDVTMIPVVSRREGAGAPGPVIATLSLAETGTDGTVGDAGRFQVVEARSDQVVIDTPTADAALTGQSELMVSGRATGFEGLVEIELRSAADGSVLASKTATAGSLGELQPFGATLRLRGTERAWLIVRSSGGAEEAASAFAAVPVSYVGPDDGTDYRVVNIGPDDPDGGLNLRAAPSIKSASLAVIPPDTPVRRRSGAIPTVTGTTTWWPVVVPSSAGGTDLEGWVASSYLAVVDRVDSQDDEASLAARYWAASEAFISFAASGVSGAGDELVFSPRLGLGVALNEADPIELRPRRQADAELLATTHSRFADRSLAEIVVGQGEAGATVDVVELTVGEPRFIHPASRRLAAGYFGGADYSTTDYTGIDGLARRTHLFFTSEPDAPAVVFGVIVEMVE